jgi:hypothetical protein
MQEARELIQAELEKTPNLDANMWRVLRECSSELIRYQGRYTRLSNLGRKEQAEALSNKFKVGFLAVSDTVQINFDFVALEIRSKCHLGRKIMLMWSRVSLAVCFLKLNFLLGPAKLTLLDGC